MTDLKRIFRQTSWQVAAKVVTTFSSVLILGYVTRNFGPTGTGVLTLVLTYFSFLVLVEDFGVNAYILPQVMSGKNYLFNKLLGFRIILSLLLLVIGLLGSFYIPTDSPDFHTLVVYGILFQLFSTTLFSSSNLIFQAKMKYEYSSISLIVGTIITMIGVLFLQPQSPLNLFIYYILGWVVMGVLPIFFVRNHLDSIIPTFDISFAKDLIKNSWPISLTLVLNVVYFRGDAFILSSYKSISEVGVYNLAYQVFQSLLVFPTFIMNGLYPVMLKSLEEDVSKFKTLLVKYSMGLFFVAVIGGVLTNIFSPYVIELLTKNSEFDGSVTSLNILAYGFPAFFVSSILMWTLVSLKKYRTMLVIYLSGLLLNLILNFIFIPSYSYVAASYITGISEYFILILLSIAVIRNIKR